MCIRDSPAATFTSYWRQPSPCAFSEAASTSISPSSAPLPAFAVSLPYLVTVSPAAIGSGSGVFGELDHRLDLRGGQSAHDDHVERVVLTEFGLGVVAITRGDSDGAFGFAEARPLPDLSEALTDVYEEV